MLVQKRDRRIGQAYSGFAIIMMAVLIFDTADSWLVRFGVGKWV